MTLSCDHPSRYKIPPASHPWNSCVTAAFLVLMFFYSPDSKAALIGYWNLDETTGQALDSSGNGRDSISIGSSVTRGEPGISGYSYRFQGTDNNEDGVNFGVGTSNTSQTLDQAIDLTGDLSISFWLRVPDGGPAGTHDVNAGVWLGDPTVSNRFVTAGITSSNTSVTLPTALGGSTVVHGGPFGSNRIDSNLRALGDDVVLTDGEWHHMALTIDGGTLMRLFLDGDLVASVSSPATYVTLPATLSKLAFGRLADSSDSGYLNGWLDEVSLYNHALSEVEVEELYLTHAIPEPATWLAMCVGIALALPLKRRLALQRQSI